MSNRRLPSGEPGRRRSGSPYALPPRRAARVVHVLGRDVAIGIALWGSWNTDVAFDLAVCSACLVLTVLGARWFGLDRQWSGATLPQPWGRAAREGFLLFVGAASIANLLRLAVGLAPWSGQGSP